MSPFSSRLLVGMDGRRPDVHLIRYASMVARLNGLPVERRSAPGDPEVRFVCLLPRKRGESASADRTYLREQVGRYFTGMSAAVPVGCDVLKGQVVARLTELAADFESDLLLAGDSTWSARTRSQLAVQAPCSVWLVPADWAPVLRHLLVPVDFSEASAVCLRVAIDLARRARGSRCLALHVHPPGQTDSRTLRRAFDEFLAKIDCHGVRVKPLLAEGLRVAPAVERAALKHGSDLIVMATRRRSRWSSLLLPSRTEEAIRLCHASFLVVKKSARPVSVLAALAERLRTGEDLQFS